MKVVLGIFEMKSRAGLFVPKVNVRTPRLDDTGSIVISAGGTRLYTSHVPSAQPIDLLDHSAKSRWIVDRFTAALFMAKGGLFEANLKGSVLIEAASSSNMITDLDLEDYAPQIERIHAKFEHDELRKWISLILYNPGLRRAIEDLMFSLLHPREAFIFIYRAFEWLEDGMNISKKEMADDLEVDLKHFKSLGQLANVGTGVRHANKHGKKLVADPMTYGSWTCALLQEIDFAVSRITKDHKRLSQDEVSTLVSSSMTVTPYS
ncbi:hypothetical protein [Terrihabitans sp. B22-R8]|uniref:hypothetical protein n=1 Tax=Terrihabitans sp. B22-R8 TaxID=3425128 RepID=UPI00403CF3A3